MNFKEQALSNGVLQGQYISDVNYHGQRVQSNKNIICCLSLHANRGLRATWSVLNQKKSEFVGMSI